MPPLLRDDVVCFIHLPPQHGFESTLRRITQRFWWPRLRGDVSAFVRACKVCDLDRCSNPNPLTLLRQLSDDNLFSLLYIDIIKGQGTISLGASPRSILSIMTGHTGWAAN